MIRLIVNPHYQCNNFMMQQLTAILAITRNTRLEWIKRNKCSLIAWKVMHDLITKKKISNKISKIKQVNFSKHIKYYLYKNFYSFLLPN